MNMDKWTDEQWQQYYAAIDNSRKESKHDTPLTAEEKEDVREYLKDREGWVDRAKTNIQNKHWRQILGGSSKSNENYDSGESKSSAGLSDDYWNALNGGEDE